MKLKKKMINLEFFFFDSEWGFCLRGDVFFYVFEYSCLVGKFFGDMIRVVKVEGGVWLIVFLIVLVIVWFIGV